MRYAVTLRTFIVCACALGAALGLYVRSWVTPVEGQIMATVHGQQVFVGRWQYPDGNQKATLVAVMPDAVFEHFLDRRPEEGSHMIGTCRVHQGGTMDVERQGDPFVVITKEGRQLPVEISAEDFQKLATSDLYGLPRTKVWKSQVHPLIRRERVRVLAEAYADPTDSFYFRRRGTEELGLVVVEDDPSPRSSSSHEREALIKAARAAAREEAKSGPEDEYVVAVVADDPYGREVACGEPDGGQFTLVLDRPAEEALRVPILIGSGPRRAQEGEDYEAIGDSVVFPAGEDTVQVPVKVRNDKVVEEPEKVPLSIIMRTARRRFAGSGRAMVIIEDNDRWAWPDIADM